ncbi:ATP-binding protein [Mordavella massiliensis]|uniref:histidine kinase n=1 Tax=Mordavella massiliensis TaxID=1871024 RepID=A0A939BAL8_9CLOT|nr:two-component sensor histidine kinase [Mordavella massiliensis]HJB86364.1 two-component sensor histidine kinase [Candidatus Dorea faecigallinarum]
MRLQTKIQKNMILIILVTLAIAYAVTTLLVYRQTVDVMEKEVRQEAGYIRAAIEISGQGYLTELDAADKDTRITLITEQGEVLYDSDQAYEADLENHAGRPEVKEALQDGTGSNVRRSDTLNEEMYYYAVQLSDGSILRVSKTMDTAFRTAVEVLPGMGVIGACMLALAALLSRWQVRRLIRPINELDLNIPLENEMYEELTPLLKRIDEQNKQKDAIADMRKEFSANVSHELKTPLTSISGYAEIMKNGLVRPEDMKGFAERIYNEASRLITLVEDIIKLSKLDEGEIEMEKEDVDLYDLTRRIVSRLAPQAEKRAVHVEVTGENVICHGVRQILDEMIYNICENAIKYNRRGGSVSVWVGATLKGKKIIVTDTGIGIPEDQQERIFERFYRVDKSHSKETGGTGLGLSIVKHGAMLHNAQIHVESKVGKGTKMELTF